MDDTTWVRYKKWSGWSDWQEVLLCRVTANGVLELVEEGRAQWIPLHTIAGPIEVVNERPT